MKNLFIQTYGCQMNAYDSIRIGDLLKPFGYKTTETIEDADIIVEDSYFSPGMVIDDFHEYLSEKQVKDIDAGVTNNDSSDFITIGEKEHSIALDGILNTDDLNSTRNYGQFWDTEGNVRVTRVVWKSFKKIIRMAFNFNYWNGNTDCRDCRD